MAATITIGNETFSLNVLIIKSEKYLPLMRSFFSERQFAQKDNEDLEKYCKRLFNNLYTRVGITTNLGVNLPQSRRPREQRQTLDNSCDSILSALGIEIIKHNPVRSQVLFKSSGNKYRMNSDEIRALSDAIKKKVSIKRKSNLDVKIGVELEFVGHVSKCKAFGLAMKNLVGADRYTAPLRYNKNEGDKWVLGKDCSVRPTGGQCGNGFAGYELTSPILDLSSAKDMEELKNVCALIKDTFSGETNATCGTHVHMSFPVKCASRDLSKHFARSYKISEDSLFDKLVPYRRRGNHARYSQSMNENYIWGRYQKLNFNNVEDNSNSMHLEFRQLDGTLDYDKIYAWCKIQKLFIDLTMDSWNVESETKTAKSVNLSDVIASDEFDSGTVEQLMKMSSMIA